MMGFSPRDFWDSSPQEIYLAISGFREYNGSDQQPEPMTSGRMKELMELYPD